MNLLGLASCSTSAIESVSELFIKVTGFATCLTPPLPGMAVGSVKLALKVMASQEYWKLFARSVWVASKSLIPFTLLQKQGFS
jgi:hypothetical protein